MELIEARYIGIDPGKKGYMVILDQYGVIVMHYKTPLIGNEYDKGRMCAMFRDYTIGDMKVHAVLENVHATPMGGKVSNFDFGRGKGLWEMALMALGVPHTMVNPKDWQKYMWQGAKTQYLATKRINKAGNAVKKVDPKATSLIAAKMLRPNQDWMRPHKKTGVPTETIDDGFVDAYLMAEYCRRKFR